MDVAQHVLTHVCAARMSMDAVQWTHAIERATCACNALPAEHAHLGKAVGQRLTPQKLHVRQAYRLRSVMLSAFSSGRGSIGTRGLR